jgi:hypothetical protein
MPRFGRPNNGSEAKSSLDISHYGIRSFFDQTNRVMRQECFSNAAAAIFDLERSRRDWHTIMLSSSSLSFYLARGYDGDHLQKTAATSRTMPLRNAFFLDTVPSNCVSIIHKSFCRRRRIHGQYLDLIATNPHDLALTDVIFAGTDVLTR